MNLGKYIRQLLPEHETVIIPGFGAFISEYKPAQTDEATGEIKPPSKEISFTSRIKNNDGLLVGYIAQSEQISAQEALGKIESERDEILYKLDKGEKVILEDTGVLFYNENREIQFEPAEGVTLLPDAFGLDSISLKDEPEEVPEEKEEVIVPAGIPEDEEVLPEDKTEKETETFAAHKPTETHSEQSSKKKKRGWLWFLLLLIPIIAAVIFILQKEEPPKPVEIKTEPLQKEDQPVQIADTLVADSITTQQADTLKADDSMMNYPDYIEPDTTKFYVIGGSFEDAENAEKYLQRMKKEGYSPFHLGKQGSFFLVGLEIHHNEIEAYGAQYNFLDKFPDSGIWVFIPE
jgi:nucleoid DNA-binding protein/cell division septation protein DedD